MTGCNCNCHICHDCGCRIRSDGIVLCDDCIDKAIEARIDALTSHGEGDEVFAFLDRLQESGQTNMVGAVPYIMLEYPTYSKKTARKLLLDWMRIKEAAS